ncbi:S24 family peptidase [uncultured Bacteroides sp.]|uniref:S24 family peptidase n=1 Tax=uncultured Bacteroides sp. TaxID=162156 RepID=UPI00262C07E7|nr:S24 family peptidase [uncultured Bacteroides sp.]
MSNILSRIQEIALNEGITIAALERSIGASKGVLSRAIANGTDIQSKWLQNIVENYPSYSAEWLIAGRGLMLRHEVAITGTASAISTSVQDDNFVSIPLVDVSVAAGCCGYDNPDYLEVVDTIKMPSSMVHDGCRYFCVHIKGESMSPTLLDSSYVVVRLLERSEWQDMPDRHVYVVSDRDGRSYIKRIKNRFSKHGFIVCMSDNIDKVNYPNFNLEEQEINSILHAEWYFSAKMPNLNETYYDKVNQLEDDMDVIKRQMAQIIKSVNVAK